MFQCLGLGSAETGGCGEDWWHPECLIGLSRDWNEVGTKQVADDGAEKDERVDHGDDEEEDTPLPPGFPGEDDFETFICYKCLDSNPWLKRYAGTPGFLPPVFKDGGLVNRGPEDEGKGHAPDTEADTEALKEQTTDMKKRKEPADDENENKSAPKRTKTEAAEPPPETTPEEPKEPTPPKHTTLPPTTPTETFSLFLKPDFRDHLCHCATCFPHLKAHPQLREEEETYEPPLSDADANEPANGGSAGTGSLYDRGEAAFNNIDRVRAIEGAMVYNHLRDKVKSFLKPFAESGRVVSAEDIKAYFERLRGDDQGIRDAGDLASGGGGNGGGGGGS